MNDRTWGPKEEEISVNDKSGYRFFITTGLMKNDRDQTQYTYDINDWVKIGKKKFNAY